MLELLTEKFSLFSGVFGASDEVLGTIESGVDFEKRILSIYQECRTPEEIDAAFQALQVEMDETIRARLDDTRKQLFEHFDEEVHQRLKLQLEDTKAQLDRFSKRFWSITRFILGKRANFDEPALTFDLEQPPREDISRGRYHLLSKSAPRTSERQVRSVTRFYTASPIRSANWSSTTQSGLTTSGTCRLRRDPPPRENSCGRGPTRTERISDADPTGDRLV